MALGAAACGNVPCELQLPPAGEPFEKLSEYCFFGGNPAALDPVEGVTPYEVNSPLYSDGSHKARFIALPPGKKIGFAEAGVWSFPEGAIIIKTFYYPEDMRAPNGARKLLETRLLIREANGWEPQIYRWNEAQTEAERFLLGELVTVEFTGASGASVARDYKIPAKSDCKSCHAQDDALVLIGPRTRQLNRTHTYETGTRNQITHLRRAGRLEGDVPQTDELAALVDPRDTTKPLERRARSYLHSNCAHCHSRRGPARNSALYLNIENNDPVHLGVCKTPIAAGRGTGGRSYSISPGKPEDSIMVYRMDSQDPAVKMPELPLRTVDRFGVELVKDWIAQMDGSCGAP